MVAHELLRDVLEEHDMLYQSTHGCIGYNAVRATLCLTGNDGTC